MNEYYNGAEIIKNAKCCHCGKTFTWDEYDCEVYRGKLLCAECFKEYYGYCNECGELNKYSDMDENIVCKGCHND